MASPAGMWLGAETDNAGRVKVQPDLSIRAFPIFSWPVIRRFVLTAGESRSLASRRSRSNRGNTSLHY